MTKLCSECGHTKAWHTCSLDFYYGIPPNWCYLCGCDQYDYDESISKDKKAITIIQKEHDNETVRLHYPNGLGKRRNRNDLQG